MITQAMCASFKLELLSGQHDLTTDALMLALYKSTASLDSGTTEYVTGGELDDPAYPIGGQALTVAAPVIANASAILTFDNLTFTDLTQNPRGALIYNASKSNKAIMVLDFGFDQISIDGKLTIRFPALTSETAILRIA